MAVILAAAMLVSSVVAMDSAPGASPDDATEAEAPVEVVVVPTPYVAPVSVWDVLARCESGGDWSAVSRGGTYRGGLQFDQPTWRSYGGGQYASSAHLASRTQQIDIATRLRNVRGYAPWPVCRRVIGV